MSNYPVSIDNDTTLPFVSDVNENGAEVINDLRDAVYNIENELGLGLSGTKGNLAARLDSIMKPDGYLKSSIFAHGSLQFSNIDIAANAEISESKLNLTHHTSVLKSEIDVLTSNVNYVSNWQVSQGSKIDTHLTNTSGIYPYNHLLSNISIDVGSLFPSNIDGTPRNTSNLNTLLLSINNELVSHQKADGSVGDGYSIKTDGGGTYSDKFAHTASGVYVNTSRFNSIKQENDDVQKILQQIDEMSYLVYGTRIQNFYSSGIPRTARSTTFEKDGYGDYKNLGDIKINNVACRMYLDTTGDIPNDDINQGDDIIELLPTSAQVSSNEISRQYSLVSIGDYVTIFYPSTNGSSPLKIDAYIKEKFYNAVNSTRKYYLRLDKKNLFSTDGYITISAPRYNTNRYGSLAVAASTINYYNDSQPSLIVGSPSAACALGQSIELNLLNKFSYNLYLELYPTGNPLDGYFILPAIDITGNKGITPGAYTVQKIVENVNNALRKNGMNSRFIAFSHLGQFGIMLSESFDGASFSIISGQLDSGGFLSDGDFIDNVCSDRGSLSTDASKVDALGFSRSRSGYASPKYENSSYFDDNDSAAKFPTVIIQPKKKTSYYVDGSELYNIDNDLLQIHDTNGDGYWIASFDSYTSSGYNNQVKYKVDLDLSSCGLKPGKTITVLPMSQDPIAYIHDFGRFVIKSIEINCNNCTTIEVYDSRHLLASNVTYTPLLNSNDLVRLYFGSDSVSFNKDNLLDLSYTTSIPKSNKYYELYINYLGETFTYERLRRASISDSTFLDELKVIYVSPKLSGYKDGSGLFEYLTGYITSYNSTSGVYSGYLSNSTNNGPVFYGRKGVPVKLYHPNNLDYIEVILDIDVTLGSITSAQSISFSLFSTLSLNDELMLISSYDINCNTNTIMHSTDLRSFGNVSEKELSTSALNYIASYNRNTRNSGVIRGFDVSSLAGLYIKSSGGTVAINGKVVEVVHNWNSDNDGYKYDAPNGYPKWLEAVTESGEVKFFAYTDEISSEPDELMRLTNTSGADFFVPTKPLKELLYNTNNICPLYLYQWDSVYSYGVRQDVRRFIGNADNKDKIIVSESDCFATCKSIEAASRWSTEGMSSPLADDGRNSIIYLQDDYAQNILLDLNIQPISNIIIDGLGKPIVSGNVSISNIGVIFRNIEFTGNINFNAYSRLCKFQNCTFNMTDKNINIFGNGASFYECNFNLNNCNVVIKGASEDSLISFIGSTIITTNEINTYYCKVIFDKCKITQNNIDKAFINAKPLLILPYAPPPLSVMFESCQIEHNSLKEFIVSVDCKTITINNCIINSVVNVSTMVDLREFINVLQDIYSVKTIITNNKFTGSYSAVLTARGVSELIVENNTIENNFQTRMNNNSFSGFIDYATGSYKVYNASTSEVLNDVNGGMIYFQPNEASTCKINNNSFYHNKPDSNVEIYRYSFITVKTSKERSILRDVEIIGNKFRSSHNSTINDVKAAILIAHNMDGYANGYTFSRESVDVLSYIINANISNNICYDKQGIVLSHYSTVMGFGATRLFETAKNSILCPINVKIDGNVCAYIGTYLFSNDREVARTSVQNDLYNGYVDRTTSINITNNNCNWISSLTATGVFIYPFKLDNPLSSVTPVVDWVCKYSADMNIIENNCSYIHISTPVCANIYNNKLTACDINLLKSFRSLRNAYIALDTAYPNPIADNYSYYYGTSQAFAISVYNGGYTGKDSVENKQKTKFVNIENNTIRARILSKYDDVVVNCDMYTYGIDTINNTALGGGYIYANAINLNISGNECSGYGSYNAGAFGGANSYNYAPLTNMRVGLFTVGGSNISIENNTISPYCLHEIPTTTSSNPLYRIWNYITYMDLFGTRQLGLGVYPNSIYPQTLGYASVIDPVASPPNIHGGTHASGRAQYEKTIGKIRNNIFLTSNCTSAAWTGVDTNASQWTVFSTSYLPLNWTISDNKNQTNVTPLSLTEQIMVDHNGRCDSVLTTSGSTRNMLDMGALLYDGVNSDIEAYSIIKSQPEAEPAFDLERRSFGISTYILNNNLQIQYKNTKGTDSVFTFEKKFILNNTLPNGANIKNIKTYLSLNKEPHTVPPIPPPPASTDGYVRLFLILQYDNKSQYENTINDEYFTPVLDSYKTHVLNGSINESSMVSGGTFIYDKKFDLSITPTESINIDNTKRYNSCNGASIILSIKFIMFFNKSVTDLRHIYANLSPIYVEWTY